MLSGRAARTARRDGGQRLTPNAIHPYFGVVLVFLVFIKFRAIPLLNIYLDDRASHPVIIYLFIIYLRPFVLQSPPTASRRGQGWHLASPFPPALPIGQGLFEFLSFFGHAPYSTHLSSFPKPPRPALVPERDGTGVGFRVSQNPETNETWLLITIGGIELSVALFHLTRRKDECAFLRGAADLISVHLRGVMANGGRCPGLPTQGGTSTVLGRNIWTHV